jgi:hypothetical protein
VGFVADNVTLGVGFSESTSLFIGGPLMVAQWLRYCAKNREVAGSIPDGVIGIFH